MTIDNILDQLDRIAEDSWYITTSDNYIELTINDFLGFDEDGSEVFREYVDPETVEEVLDWLIENSDYIEGRGNFFYHYINFGNILVRVGYTSFEI